MNKVITINLGGTAFQLEEAGYEALRLYLEEARTRLKDNPDREEIISDIERAMGDKFRALLSSFKNVVEQAEVMVVLKELGTVEAEPGVEAGATADAKPEEGQAKQPADEGVHGPGPRRLYRIQEGAMIAGVCNGLAAYGNLDPTLVRLGFVLLTIFWGTGLLVYVVMAFLVPEAKSPEERAAATGFPATAQEFIRRAKTGYYEALKHFPDRKAHRMWRKEWRRQCKREMRAQTGHWWGNWQAPGAPLPPMHPGAALALPVLSLLQGAALLFWICAVISLLATDAVLGMTLPATVPVWAAVLVLCFVYGVIAGPIKLARKSLFWGAGRPGPGWALFVLMDSLIWVAVAVILVMLAVHFFPELRDAVHGIPGHFHQATNDIRQWWHGN